MLSKTKNRTEMLKALMDVISSRDIYDVIDYRRSDESSIKQFMYQPLLECLTEVYVTKSRNKDKAKAKAKAKLALIWESSKQTTLHNIMLFGVQHRPDMEVNFNGLKIAIEVKKGEQGNDIRSGFGQCLMYQSYYDFILYLFVDTSKDKRLLNSMTGEKEKSLIGSLWDHYNVMFNIV